jgi:hypothetical protein
MSKKSKVITKNRNLICEICDPDYQFCKRSNFERHLKSDAHKKKLIELANIRTVSFQETYNPQKAIVPMWLNNMNLYNHLYRLSSLNDYDKCAEDCIKIFMIYHKLDGSDKDITYPFRITRKVEETEETKTEGTESKYTYAGEERLDKNRQDKYQFEIAVVHTLIDENNTLIDPKHWGDLIYTSADFIKNRVREPNIYYIENNVEWIEFKGDMFKILSQQLSHIYLENIHYCTTLQCGGLDFYYGKNPVIPTINKMPFFDLSYVYKRSNLEGSVSREYDKLLSSNEISYCHTSINDAYNNITTVQQRIYKLLYEIYADNITS